MGFMEKWSDWSDVQWEKWGKKLQPMYTKIDEWKTPDWVQEILGEVWDLLDAELQKKLYKLVKEICKDYDAEFAKALIEKIKAAIKKFFSK